MSELDARSVNIDRLKRRLRVRGTTLAQTPPTWEGITWREWEQVRWADMREEAEKARTAEPVPVRPISSARDRYGWRSLPPGSRYLGKE